MLINNRSKSTAEIDVLVLCGGAGSRLRPLISDLPKGMALIGGRPFLDILVDDLVKQGFRRIIFCVGHLKEQIIDRFKLRSDANFEFSEEDVLLGTGGAVQNALLKIKSNPILILNGDSICPVNYGELLRFHCAKASSATFVLADPQERIDGGSVFIDGCNKVQFFLEKTSIKPPFKGYINAGVYLLELESLVFSGLKPPFSLEFDIFPTLTKSKSCYGFVVESKLVDIGTPDRYLKASREGIITS
jgi:D-glycero-alpha-D-manno-heptose 1-phosphate guanylyltransferase